MTAPQGSRTAAEIADWLRTRLASLMRCSPDRVDVTATFDSFALDSAAAVAVTLDLEDWLGREIDPAALYDHPTIERVSEALATRGATTDD